MREEVAIETDRLFIRPFKTGDYQDLHEYLSQPEVYRFEPGRPITSSEARKLSRARARGRDFLAVILKESGKMIGHLYLHRLEPQERKTWELGYIFSPAYQRKGYASEAAAAATRYVFASRAAHRIMARCSPDNTASWKLLERIGFVREGHFRSYGFVHRDREGNPVWTDAYEYSRVAEA